MRRRLAAEGPASRLVRTVIDAWLPEYSTDCTLTPRDGVITTTGVLNASRPGFVSLPARGCAAAGSGVYVRCYQPDVAVLRRRHRRPRGFQDRLFQDRVVTSRPPSPCERCRYSVTGRKLRARGGPNVGAFSPGWGFRNRAKIGNPVLRPHCYGWAVGADQSGRVAQARGRKNGRNRLVSNHYGLRPVRPVVPLPVGRGFSRDLAPKGQERPPGRKVRVRQRWAEHAKAPTACRQAPGLRLLRLHNRG